MNRWLAVVVIVLLVLASAVGLRNVVNAKGQTPVVMANGSGPIPPTPWSNGSGPIPPTPWSNGSGPIPPTPWSR